MNYTPNFLYLLAFVWLFSGSAAHAQVSAGHRFFAQAKYEEAYSAYAKDKDNEKKGAESLYGLANVFNQEAFSGYNPDSSWFYLNKAQIKKRKLSSSAQNSLRKKGYDEAYVSKLKGELREKAVRQAIARGSTQALDQVMETYKPLNNKQKQTIVTARNVLALSQIESDYGYDSLVTFLKKYQSSILEYTPEMAPRIQQSAWRLYFMKYDSTHTRDVLLLLRDFPSLAAQADLPLSKALAQRPYIVETEMQLKETQLREMPQTMRTIYFYYWLSGEEPDLTNFQNRYPAFAQSVGIDKELELAARIPKQGFPFSEVDREQYETFIRDAAPRHSAVRILHQMIEPDVKAKRWQAAIRQVESLRSFFPEDDIRITGLLRTLKAPSVAGILPEPLKGTANTELGEYAPVISANGQYLYFCRNENDSGGNSGNENIYVASNKDGQWVDARPAGNWKDPYVHEAPLDISADGTMLLLFKSGTLMYSFKEQLGWSKEQLFFEKGNTPEWRGAASVAATREAVVFEARRKDCFGIRKDGNIDIFVALKEADGSWSEPINLGAAINTPFNDRSPFLHPDMRTLYFSSEGHGSIGDMDVYKTTRVGDGWLEWTPPVNLGKEINTSGDDWGYRISTDGVMAYFAADAKNGKEDIFSVILPDAARPEAVGTISGKLMGLDGKPIAAKIEIRDLATNEKIDVISPDPQTGEYYIVVPLGKIYGYVVSGESYFPVSGSVDLRRITSAQNKVENIIAPSVAEMEKESVAVPLKNLFFDHDEATLKAESNAQLAQLVAFMKSTPYRIEIAGHTDNTGSATYNLELSRNRANAVRQYLIQQGCEANRIEAFGLGMANPVASNDTESGRAQNRRVEIRIAKAKR
ncbi:MAG: OmpA family protein [Saprospiraceae bacterium]|nr:OmpA family protein [Saprospiraceae bacterium]